MCSSSWYKAMRITEESERQILERWASARGARRVSTNGLPSAHMRLLLIRSALPMLAVLAAWPFAGARVSAWLDRVFTMPDASLPLGRYAIDSSQFIIGTRRWWVTSDLPIAADAQHRVTLSSAGRSFTFDPINSCSASAIGAPECYGFSPEPGDAIAFVKTRSARAWPTPFEFSLMGAPLTSWHRHAYDRLRWKKASGEQLDMVWRDEQGFYAKVGWTDGHLQIAPVVTITPKDNPT